MCVSRNVQTLEIEKLGEEITLCIQISCVIDGLNILYIVFMRHNHSHAHHSDNTQKRNMNFAILF